jgi:hypothetical protein
MVLPGIRRSTGCPGHGFAKLCATGIRRLPLKGTSINSWTRISNSKAATSALSILAIVLLFTCDSHLDVTNLGFNLLRPELTRGALKINVQIQWNGSPRYLTGLKWAMMSAPIRHQNSSEANLNPISSINLSKSKMPQF